MLSQCLTELAATPDDSPDMAERLAQLAHLAVNRVGAADYASITGLRHGSYTTVAVSDDLIRAIDDIQQDDQDGPCVEALRRQRPTALPHLKGSVRWPGFAREALRLGLLASVSMPLFTASGIASAVLNLYGRDDAAMAPLIAGVWHIFDPDDALPMATAGLQPLDDGGRELLAGFEAAVETRATIQQALIVLVKRHGDSRRQAYERLVATADDATLSLLAVAERLRDED